MAIKHRRTIAIFAVMAFVLFGAVAPIVLAQVSNPAPGPTPVTYEVQEGDNLWTLADLYRGDPTKWTQLLEMNPFLSEKGRIFENKDGKLVVLVRPGERLAGLEELGITPAPLPISALAPRAPASTSTSASSEGGMSWLQILLILLFALLALAFAIALATGLFRSPVRSGPPVVPNGIPPNNPRGIADRFRDMADRRNGELHPTTAMANLVRPRRIGPITEGTLSGIGSVGYDGGVRMPRVMHNEPAYRARFQFADGHQEELYFLQGCANDVVLQGARYFGFTFREGRAVAEPPAPQPAVAETTQPTTLRAVPQQPPVFAKMTLLGQEYSVPVGSEVAVEDGAVRITVPHACEIRVRQIETRKASTKPKAVASPKAVSNT